MTSRLFASVFGVMLAFASGAQERAGAADALQGRLDALEAGLARDGAVSEADLPTVRQWLEQARQAVGRLDVARSFEADAAARIAGLEAVSARDVDASHAQWLRRLPATASRATLEAALQEAQTRIAEERRLLAEAPAQIGGGELSAPQGERLAELDARLDALQRQPPPLPMRSAVERLAIEAEIAAIQRERATSDLRWRQAEAQVAAAQTVIAELELRIATLQERISGSDQREVEALQRSLVETRESIADPFLRSVAESTEALAGRLAEQSARLVADRRAERAAELARENTARSLAAVQSRIGLDVAEESLGALLLAERRGLDKPDRLSARIAELRQEIATLRLQLLELPQQAEWPVPTQLGDDEIEAGTEGAAAPASASTMPSPRSCAASCGASVRPCSGSCPTPCSDALTP